MPQVAHAEFLEDHALRVEVVIPTSFAVRSQESPDELAPAQVDDRFGWESIDDGRRGNALLNADALDLHLVLSDAHFVLGSTVGVPDFISREANHDSDPVSSGVVFNEDERLLLDAVKIIRSLDSTDHGIYLGRDRLDAHVVVEVNLGNFLRVDLEMPRVDSHESGEFLSEAVVVSEVISFFPRMPTHVVRRQDELLQPVQRLGMSSGKIVIEQNDVRVEGSRSESAVLHANAFGVNGFVREGSKIDGSEIGFVDLGVGGTWVVPPDGDLEARLGDHRFEIVEILEIVEICRVAFRDDENSLRWFSLLSKRGGFELGAQDGGRGSDVIWADVVKACGKQVAVDRNDLVA